MELSLEESRVFRHLPKDEMETVYRYCKHREYKEITVSEGRIYRCIRCYRWWFPRETYPPPFGNPSLERFLRPCEHTLTRTLEGTTTMNKCMECDAVFKKNPAAVVWKNLRERTGDLFGIVGGVFAPPPQKKVEVIKFSPPASPPTSPLNARHTPSPRLTGVSKSEEVPSNQVTSKSTPESSTATPQSSPGIPGGIATRPRTRTGGGGGGGGKGHSTNTTPADIVISPQMLPEPAVISPRNVRYVEPTEEIY